MATQPVPQITAHHDETMTFANYGQSWTSQVSNFKIMYLMKIEPYEMYKRIFHVKYVNKVIDLPVLVEMMECPLKYLKVKAKRKR